MYVLHGLYAGSGSLTNHMRNDECCRLILLYLIYTLVHHWKVGASDNHAWRHNICGHAVWRHGRVAVMSHLNALLDESILFYCRN